MLADPAPQIAIQEFSGAGPVLAVRPYCAMEHYQQVFFDANEAIVIPWMHDSEPPATMMSA